ncbi:progestin and adipoQ receptor family member 4 isoform 2-T3 [Erethizon dorsatum]
MAFLAGPRLLDWASSPPHLQFNKFVLTGYRPASSGSGCLRSLFYLHNELGNIYTHGGPRTRAGEQRRPDAVNPTDPRGGSPAGFPGAGADDHALGSAGQGWLAGVHTLCGLPGPPCGLSAVSPLHVPPRGQPRVHPAPRPGYVWGLPRQHPRGSAHHTLYPGLQALAAPSCIGGLHYAVGRGRLACSHSPLYQCAAPSFWLASWGPPAGVWGPWCRAGLRGPRLPALLPAHGCTGAAWRAGECGPPARALGARPV